MASETEAEPRKPTFTHEEEKEIFSHPFFARSTKDMEGNIAYEALQALKYESEDPNANAEAYKEEGNYYVKKKEFEKAVLAYSGGIKAKPPDKKLLATLYTNRGIANALWKNYGSCVKDCKLAIEQDPTHLKAYLQATKSLLILSKASEALEVCEAGLKVDPDNSSLGELKQKAIALQAALAAEAAKKANVVAEHRDKLGNTFAQLKRRNIAIDFKQPPMGLPEHAAVEISFDHLNLIHWPVLVIYPEFRQTDFVQDVAEYLTIRECLKHVLNPAEPPLWDKDKAYTTDLKDLEVYFESSEGGRMVKVSISRTFTELTRWPGFYVRRDLVIGLLVVSKRSKNFYKKWLEEIRS